MASLRAAGSYEIFIENPNGERRQVKSADSSWWNVSGLGSPDGSISTSATPEKMNKLFVPGVRGGAGYKIVVVYKASAATTLDASDCVGIIPVTILTNQGPLYQTIGANGGNGINNDNFVSEVALADSAYVANQPTVAFSIRAKEGVVFYVGAPGDDGRVFLSLEDNTA